MVYKSSQAPTVISLICRAVDVEPTLEHEGEDMDNGSPLSKYSHKPPANCNSNNYFPICNVRFMTIVFVLELRHVIAEFNDY